MGVKAGRLEIEIVAEVARLQKDLDLVKRSVRSASGDIVRNMRAANDNISGLGTGFRRVTLVANQFSKATVAAGKSAAGFVSAANGMAAAIGFIGVAAAGRKLLSLADEYKQFTAQLKLATAQSGSFGVAQEDVRRIASETRSTLADTADLYATFARTSHELGLSQEQVARITQTVNQSFKISGATQSEVAGATRQLVQAFQSGVLRGEEFNSVMENAPRLARLLAESLNVPIGSLRGMAKEGELTADKLARAFSNQKFTAGLDAEFRELPVTFDEAMGQVHNAAILTFGAFDRGGEFSTAIANFVMDGSSGFRNLEVEAENLGIEIRATFEGLSDVWRPLVEAAMDAFGLIGDGAVSLADRFRPLMGEIDTISGWVGKQGLIGRLATGGSVSDWWNERPTRGTTLLRDFDESYNRTRNDLNMKKIFRADPLASMGLQRTSGGSSAAAITAAEKATNKRANAGARHAAMLAREAEATEALISGLYKLTDAYLEGDAAAMKAEITAKATAQGIKKRADLEEFVSRQIRLAVAQRTADAAKEIANLLSETDALQILNNQVAQGLITSEEANRILKDEATLRPFIAAQALAEGDAKAKLTGVIAELRDAQKKANEEAIRAQDLAQAAQIREQIALTSEETRMTAELGKARVAALKGLNGYALEDELARLNHQHEQGLLTMRAQVQADKERAAGLHDTAQATLDAASAAARLADQEFVNDQEVRDIERANAELQTMISLLQQIGGLGRVIGGALGILSGNYGAIGGKLGAVLNMVTGTKIGADGKEIAVRFGDQLKDVFGLTGEFAATMTSVLKTAGQGAVIGDATDSIMKALGVKSSNTGAQLGGAAGMAAFGPIGAVGGAILGGIIGGLFKSTKWGRAVLTNASGDFAVEGNKGAFKSAATDAGNAVVDALNQIAKSLGGTLGEFDKIAIGVRDGKWRVNVGGTSLKTSKGAVDFGKDGAEEAVAYAIQQAIKMGAIDGLRQSTLNLLKAGDDFQAQLEKALAFENVFKSLEAQTNPLKAALKGIQAEFEQLTIIFKEAGATAAEYAQLQAYIEQQQAAAIDAASATYRANFYTAAENEAYAKKQIKTQMTALGYADVDTVAEYKRLVESIDTSTEEGLTKYGELMALADEFATLQQAAEQRAAEAAQAAAEAQALALQKGQMEVELLRLQGKELEALKKERQLALDAIDPSLRALQQEIHKAQDLANAKEVLRTAYDRESEGLRQTTDEMKSMGDTLRDFRKGLFATGSAGLTYTQALAELMKVGALAGTGDKGALGNLPDVGRTFIDVATRNARSDIEVQRAIALVAQYADQAIGYTDSAASEAERALAKMDEQVGALISIRDEVVSVDEAIERLIALNTANSGGGNGGGNSGRRGDDGERTRDQMDIFMESLRERFSGLQSGIDRSVRASERLNRVFDQVMPDGDSIRVSWWPDAKMTVEPADTEEEDA